MGTTSEKLTYLNTTKGKIKDSINLTGANITTEPFRQYSTKLEDAYIDIINNGTDTLYNNFPKVSGEGTSLTLNNTYQAPMRNNLKGNTSQTGTPTPTSPIPVNVVSGDNEIHIIGKNFANIRDTLITTAIKGLTFVYNQNGSFSYSGTLTNHTYLTFTNRFYNKLEAGAYTISIDKTIDYRLIWNMTYEDGTTDYYTLQPGSKSRTITFSKNIVSYYFDFTGLTTGTTYNDTLKLMIEKGNQVTDFEPYQGNTYNIDLPVENLLNLTQVTLIGSGSTQSNIQTNSITLNGTGAWSNTYFFITNTSKNTNYTASCKAFSSIARKSGISIYGASDTSGSGLTSINGVTEDMSANVLKTYINSFNSGNYEYLAIRLWTNVTGTPLGSNVDLNISDIMLEVGTKANTFVPYGTTPIELCKIGNYQDGFGKSDGRNLFDGVLEIGGYGGTGEKNDALDNYRNANIIQVKPSTTYTFSINGVSQKYVLLSYDANKVFIGQTLLESGTFTTGNNVYFINFRCYQSDFTNDFATLKVQLEKGSSATPWQPYGVGKWYLHKEIGKYTFTGNESITLSLTPDVFYINNAYTNALINDVNIPLCDLFIGATPKSNAANMGGSAGNNTIAIDSGTNKRFYFKTNVYTTTSQLATGLTGKSIYWIYETPTSTEITDTTLINQLEEFYQAQSKENQTNISQINNDLGFIISASALKKG